MKFPHAKIRRVTRGKYKNLAITFELMEDDYTIAEYLELEQHCIDGAIGSIEWIPSLEPAKEKEMSVYQRFQFDVKRDFGDEAYKQIKASLGVEHLKDLEAGLSQAEIESLLAEELHNLKSQSGYYQQP